MFMSFYLYIINLEFEASNAWKQYKVCTGLGKSLKLKQIRFCPKKVLQMLKCTRNKKHSQPPKDGRANMDMDNINWKWRNDRRSECNLCNSIKKPEKNSGFQWGLNPWGEIGFLQKGYLLLVFSISKGSEYFINWSAWKGREI